MAPYNEAFDRSVYDRDNERASQGGGDFLPWEMEKMNFDVGETFYVRFLAMLGVFGYDHHWPSSGMKDACTAKLPEFGGDPVKGGGKCVYCQHFGSKEKGKLQYKDVFEVIDFRYFHIVPSPKKSGSFVVKRCAHDDPVPKHNRCVLCNNGNAEQATRYFGGHKLWEVNNEQYLQIMSAHGKLQGTCVAALGTETIEGKEVVKICGEKTFLLAFLCPKCEATLLDEDEIRKSADQQIATFRKTKQKCKCGHEDYPYGIYACEGDGRTPTPSEIEKGVPPEKGSHWVVRGSLFDKVLECTVAGQTKKIGKDDVKLKQLSFSTGEDWSRVDDDLKAFGQTDENIVKMCEAWNLDEKYRPGAYVKDAPKRDAFKDDIEGYVAAVLDMQAANCGKPNPYGGSGGGRGSFAGKGEETTGRRSFKR